jgi:hypothetical protein
MLTVTATSSTTEMDALLQRLQPAALQVPCTEAARAIQVDYVDSAPKDTTSMVLSCYVVPALGEPQDNYSGRTNAARAVNRPVEILPALPAPPAPGAVVGVAAGHAKLVEYGEGHGRNATPRPAFTAAGDAERARFAARVAQAVWHG